MDDVNDNNSSEAVKELTTKYKLMKFAIQSRGAKVQKTLKCYEYIPPLSFR
jgi:hypothetical protein